MSILSDKEIKELALEQGMITPFEEKLVRTKNGKKVISYGLSSYGYDIRFSPKQCLIFGRPSEGDCDPKDFNRDILKPAELHTDERGQYFLLPPYSYCLGVAEECLKMPEDVTALAIGKSTYARSGILANLTPIEAAWEGHLTLEISNCTGLFNRIYADEGICQLIFFRGEPCSTTYETRSGKYQGQPLEVVVSKV